MDCTFNRGAAFKTIQTSFQKAKILISPRNILLEADTVVLTSEGNSATKTRSQIVVDDLWMTLMCHYNNVIMGAIASQITSLTIVYSAVYSDADQRKHQSSASLAFVGGIHRGPVNSPRKWPVTRKMFPFDDFIMYWHILAKVCSAIRSLWFIVLDIKCHGMNISTIISDTWGNSRHALASGIWNVNSLPLHFTKS